MDTTVTIEWNLRQIMAARGMFATSDLVPLLAERNVHLSREQVYRLVTKTPQRLNIDVLAALCDILQVTPNDLIEVRVQRVTRATKTGSGGGSVSGVGELRPPPAQVRRPKTQ